MKFLAQWRIRKPADDAQTVYVSERFGVRSLHIGSDTIQSSMRLARPHDLELAYTRAMMAFLLFHESPRDIVMIGLGGGSLAKFVYHRLPSAVVRAVEISAEVIAISRQCFKLPPNDHRLSVICADGAQYVRREDVCADVLLVDGYDGEAQVEALASGEFYAACAARLNPGGVVVVNLWSGDRQFTESLERIQAAFPSGTLCLPAEKPGNVIAFGFRDAPDPVLWSELARRADRLEAKYGLEFMRFVSGLRKMNRHDDQCLLL
jgi:spermidine synthase